MTQQNMLAASALALRDEFDRAFAMPPAQPDARDQQLLAIRAGGQPYALRLSAIRGLYVDRRVQALPSRLPELLGLTGVRGQAVPVFDLAALLGLPAQRAPRWLALASGRHSAAFAFEQFDAHHAVHPDDFLPAPEHAFVEAAVRMDDTPRPLLSLQSLIDDLERRCQRLGSL
ncbi:MAG TPA: chemotaxis protein CheW [Pseudoduganella sp.]